MLELEEGTDLQIDFLKIKKVAESQQDLIPVIVQDQDTQEVILLAYTNMNAMRKSIDLRRAIFWSTSRDALWDKGDTSGNSFDLISISINCEQNSLLYKVRAKNGKICHTRNAQGKARNCYYRTLNFDTGKLENTDK